MKYIIIHVDLLSSRSVTRILLSDEWSHNKLLGLQAWGEFGHWVVIACKYELLIILIYALSLCWCYCKWLLLRRLDIGGYSYYWCQFRFFHCYLLPFVILVIYKVLLQGGLVTCLFSLVLLRFEWWICGSQSRPNRSWTAILWAKHLFIMNL